MKKLSSIFIFLIVIMCVFLLPEVYAYTIDFDYERHSAADDVDLLEEEGCIEVVVAQGSNKVSRYKNREKNANCYANDWTYNCSSYTVAAEEEIEVFIYTKEESAHGEKGSVTVTGGDYKISGAVDGKGYDDGGNEDVSHYAFLFKIKLKEDFEGEGTKTVTFWVQDESGSNSKVGFSLTITFKVKEAYPFDFDESCIELEQKCDSTDFAIQIGSENNKIMDGIHKGKKNITEINVDASNVSIQNGKPLQIIAYYERVNMKNTGYSFNVRSDFDYSVFEIISIQCKPGHKGYDSCVGELKLYIKRSVDSITIPLHMSVYVGSNKVEFDINIKVNISESDERENADFEDVLTNTDYYTPTGGSSEGIDKLENKVGVILTVITNIGIVLCVLVSAILGIKYMLASVEAKAEIKQDLVPYVIGVSLLFGICVFVKILQAVGSGFNT